MKVTRETMRMEACSLCSPVAETGLMLSPLTPSHSLHERLASYRASLSFWKNAGAFGAKGAIKNEE